MRTMGRNREGMRTIKEGGWGSELSKYLSNYLSIYLYIYLLSI